jgi:hypothetical protein
MPAFLKFDEQIGLPRAIDNLLGGGGSTRLRFQ